MHVCSHVVIILRFVNAGSMLTLNVAHQFTNQGAEQQHEQPASDSTEQPG